MPNGTSMTESGVKTAAGINLLLGIWLFISPWVYGAAGHPNAWNNWIVGFIIFVFSLIQVSDPIGNRGFAWANLVLGVWTFVSPWIYGFAGNHGRFVNSLCVGVVLFVLSAYSATAHITRTTHLHDAPLTH